MLAGKLAKDTALLAGLTAEKDALQAGVDALRARSSALDDPKALLVSIRNPKNNEVRLRARSEIRKCVARIDFDFEPLFHEETGDIIVRIYFVNGSERAIIIGEKATWHYVVNVGEKAKLEEMLDKLNG